MSNTLKDVSVLYSNLKVNPSRKSGTLTLDNRYGLRVDDDQKPSEWVVFDASTGDFIDQAGVPEHGILIKSFTDDWNKLSGCPATDPLDNLKAGGFEISNGSEKIDEAELKTSEEEEQKIIEMERREKAAEAENARKLAENEDIIVMAMPVKQTEEDIQPTQSGGVSSSVTELPHIEFTTEVTEISRHTRVYISVRGSDLAECRKHFDEIRGGL